MEAFKTSAEYYEILANDEKRLEREGPFLLGNLEKRPGVRVADIACGTGTHALFFAEHGATVTAFDLSGDMIAHAQQRRAHPSIDYRVGDMRRLDGGPWDLAVCLGNSLSLLRTPEDLDATFAAVFRCLSPGGLFVTQTLNYEAATCQNPRHRVQRATTGEVEVIAVKSLVPHGDHTLLTLDFFAEQRGEFKSVSESTVLRNWRCADLTDAAERNGFTVEQTAGAFDGTPFNPHQSGDVVLVSKRQGQ